MVADDDLLRDTVQLAEYRKSNTLSHILDKYAALIEDHRRLKSDYEEERDAREKYKQMARGQERNPFVLVLVDGDGYIFNEDLIGGAGKAIEGEGSAERLARGGTNAARLLNDAIKASLRRKGLEHCQVMVRVYANVAGLSKALSKAGLVGAEKRSFAPFIASFNRSSGLSDFIDAGELKENADFKLRSLLQLYADNAQCKHIYFAACHDVGYISDLTPHAGNSARFTLVSSRGIMFHNEFAKLGMGVEELPGVFRTTPLDGPAFYRPPNGGFSTVTSNKPASSPVKHHTSTSAPAVADSNRQVCEFHKLGKCKYGAGCKFLHLASPANTSSWRSSSYNDRSDTNGSSDEPWSASPSKTLPRKEDIPQGHIAVNKANYRLDPYIKPPSAEATAELRARVNRQRLCNNYHLNGSCEGNCDFDHSPLDAELKRALETLARSQPCPKRGGCRKVNCTYGHICQTLDCKHRKGKAFCKLPYASHGEDLHVDRYLPAETRPRQTRQPSSADVNWVEMGDDLPSGKGVDDNKDGDEDEDEEEQTSMDGSNGASI